MPYEIVKAPKKKGYYVIDTSGRRYEKNPISLSKAKKQLIALHIHTGHGLNDIVIPKKAFIKEHKNLLKVLASKNPKKLKAEAKDQSKELKKVLLRKGGVLNEDQYQEIYHLVFNTYLELWEHDESVDRRDIVDNYYDDLMLLLRDRYPNVEEDELLDVVNDADDEFLPDEDEDDEDEQSEESEEDGVKTPPSKRSRNGQGKYKLKKKGGINELEYIPRDNNLQFPNNIALLHDENLMQIAVNNRDARILKHERKRQRQLAGLPNNVEGFMEGGADEGSDEELARIFGKVDIKNKEEDKREFKPIKKGFQPKPVKEQLFEAPPKKRALKYSGKKRLASEVGFEQGYGRFGGMIKNPLYNIAPTHANLPHLKNSVPNPIHVAEPKKEIPLPPAWQKWSDKKESKPESKPKSKPEPKYEIKVPEYKPKPTYESKVEHNPARKISIPKGTKDIATNAVANCILPMGDCLLGFASGKKHMKDEKVGGVIGIIGNAPDFMIEDYNKARMANPELPPIEEIDRFLNRDDLLWIRKTLDSYKTWDNYLSKAKNVLNIEMPDNLQEFLKKRNAFTKNIPKMKYYLEHINRILPAGNKEKSLLDLAIEAEAKGELGPISKEFKAKGKYMEGGISSEAFHQFSKKYNEEKKKYDNFGFSVDEHDNGEIHRKEHVYYHQFLAILLQTYFPKDYDKLILSKEFNNLLSLSSAKNFVEAEKRFKDMYGKNNTIIEKYEKHREYLGDKKSKKFFYSKQRAYTEMLNHADQTFFENQVLPLVQEKEDKSKYMKEFQGQGKLTESDKHILIGDELQGGIAVQLKRRENKTYYIVDAKTGQVLEDQIETKEEAEEALTDWYKMDYVVPTKAEKEQKIEEKLNKYYKEQATFTHSPTSAFIKKKKGLGYGKHSPNKIKFIKKYLKGQGIPATKKNVVEICNLADVEGVVFEK